MGEMSRMVPEGAGLVPATTGSMYRADGCWAEKPGVHFSSTAPCPWGWAGWSTCGSGVRHGSPSCGRRCGDGSAACGTTTTCGPGASWTRPGGSTFSSARGLRCCRRWRCFPVPGDAGDVRPVQPAALHSNLSVCKQCVRVEAILTKCERSAYGYQMHLFSPVGGAFFQSTTNVG